MRHDAHEVQGKAYGTGAGGVGVWHTAWAYGMSRDIRRGTRHRGVGAGVWHKGYRHRACGDEGRHRA
jgi:hypothetical protein